MSVVVPVGKQAPLLVTLLQLALAALLYWVAARLSLGLALVHGQVTPIWPPTGIALVAILVFGRRMALSVFAGALAVNLPIGPSLLGAACIATGNTLAPLVASELLRLVGFRLELDRLRDAAAIIVLGALLSMMISATVGSSVLVLWRSVPATGFWPTWAVWWAGDAMGVLLVAPFLLSVLVRPPSPPLTLGSGLLLVSLLAGIGVVTFGLFQNPLRLEYLVFPLIMVAAWRYRLRGAAPAALIASGVAIWSAVQGNGPFFNEGLLQKMVTLQVFNVCVALTSFVLASFVETREREERVRRLYESASAANQAKTEFLSMAAHELRGPITVLNGYLTMLAGGSLGSAPGPWEKPMDVLSSKTGELSKIVDDLLDASRLEVDSSSPVREAIDLRTVIEDAVDRARPRAALLEADVRCALPDTPCVVEADADQLGRVVDNLMNNALTYTVGVPRIAISLSCDAHQSIIRITDEGIGIPANQRDRIFERFVRSTDPTMAKVSGVGLGLYISRRIADAHGGSLVVESSDPGAGSVFALTLPSAELPTRTALS